MRTWYILGIFLLAYVVGLFRPLYIIAATPTPTATVASAASPGNSSLIPPEKCICTPTEQALTKDPKLQEIILDSSCPPKDDPDYKDYTCASTGQVGGYCKTATDLRTLVNTGAFGPEKVKLFWWDVDNPVRSTASKGAELTNSLFGGAPLPTESCDAGSPDIFDNNGNVDPAKQKNCRCIDQGKQVGDQLARACTAITHVPIDDLWDVTGNQWWGDIAVVNAISNFGAGVVQTIGGFSGAVPNEGFYINILARPQKFATIVNELYKQSKQSGYDYKNDVIVKFINSKKSSTNIFGGVDPIANNHTAQSYYQCLNCAAANKYYSALGCIPVTNTGAFIAFAVFQIGLGIAGVYLLGIIAYSAIALQTSRGNPDTIKKANASITAGFQGIVLIASSLLIVRIVAVYILKIPGLS